MKKQTQTPNETRQPAWAAKATAAIVRVGDGRGFVVEKASKPVVPGDEQNGYGKVISGCKEGEHWNPESKSATALYFGAKFNSRLVGRVLTFERLKKLNLNHRTWSYPGTLLELEDAHDIRRIRAAFDDLAARPNVLAGELEVLGFMEGEKKLLREHLRREAQPRVSRAKEAIGAKAHRALGV